MNPPHRNPFSIRRVSSVKAKLNREYKRLREKFLTERPWCEACTLYGVSKQRSVDVHHQRGRSRKLQNDERFWRAVCKRCHLLIHQDIPLARQLGLICEKGKWMVQDPL